MASKKTGQITVTLPNNLAERVMAEAAQKDLPPEEIISALIDALFEPEVSHTQNPMNTKTEPDLETPAIREPIRISGNSGVRKFAYNLSECAKSLGFKCTESVRRLIAKGLITPLPHSKRRILVAITELERFVEQETERAKSAARPAKKTPAR